MPKIVDVDEKWPFFFSDSLLIGNRKSNVAICTLWSLKETATKDIPHDRFALAGNMYYNHGINYLLRAVLSNPNIRYIILCGVDIAKSGENLLKMMNKGINDHQIAGSAVELEKEIPAEAIELFRKNVQVVDMRNVVDSKKILETINKLQPKDAFAKPQIFPTPPHSKISVLTSEKTGFVVREKTVAEAWYQILNLVMKFGTTKKSQHSSDQRELINLVAVVEDENPDEPKIEKWCWYSKDDIENYYPQVMSAKVPVGVDYTYGNRLRLHAFGKNQIEYIINDLKKTKYSRRAVAVTWQHDKDMQNANPPCWGIVQALIQEEKLYLTCYIRSNDMFAAWPLNAFGLRKIQKEIAAALDVEMGPLTTVSCSAHIYEHDWTRANNILEKYRLPQRWNWDPRGNFVIKLDREKREIIIDYYTSEMKKVETFSFPLNANGKTVIDIYNKLISLGLISQLSHAADLGAELLKAELALRYGLKYSQDDPLDLSEKA
jgi:thymidylate synthase